MASNFFKGIKILTKEQHSELIETGYYTMPDGTKVQRDDEYWYASKEEVDLEALAETVKSNTEEIQNTKDTLSNYQTKEETETSIKSMLPMIIEEV